MEDLASQIPKFVENGEGGRRGHPQPLLEVSEGYMYTTVEKDMYTRFYKCTCNVYIFCIQDFCPLMNNKQIMYNQVI